MEGITNIDERMTKEEVPAVEGAFEKEIFYFMPARSRTVLQTFEC
jgi:hypothetical protein